MFFDLFVTLDPANLDKDTGTMSVTGTLTGGTFDDFLTAYIIAQFRTTGSQQTVQEAVSLNFTKVEYRNISLVNDNVQQVGFDSDPPSILSYSLAQLTADQAANEHTGLAPDEIDLHLSPPPYRSLPPASAHWACSAGAGNESLRL